MVRKLDVSSIFKVSKRQERLIQKWANESKSLSEKKKAEESKLDRKFQRRFDSLSKKYKRLGLLGLR